MKKEYVTPELEMIEFDGEAQMEMSGVNSADYDGSFVDGSQWE